MPPAATCRTGDSSAATQRIHCTCNAHLQRIIQVNAFHHAASLGVGGRCGQQVGCQRAAQLAGLLQRCLHLQKGGGWGVSGEGLQADGLTQAGHDGCARYVGSAMARSGLQARPWGVTRRCNLVITQSLPSSVWAVSARLRTLLCSASSTSGTQLHTDFNGGSTGSVRARL